MATKSVNGMNKTSMKLGSPSQTRNFWSYVLPHCSTSPTTSHGYLHKIFKRVVFSFLFCWVFFINFSSNKYIQVLQKGGKWKRERGREDHEKRNRGSCNSLKKTDNTCCCTAAEPEPKRKKKWFKRSKTLPKEKNNQYPYTILISSTTKSPNPNCLPLTFVSSPFISSLIRQRCHHYSSFIITNTV